MYKLIIAGWDPGRLNNKLYLENGRMMNMNALCAGYERRVLAEEEGDLKNFLDVEIYQGEEYLGRYFIGAMAYKYHRGDLRWATKGVPKFDNNTSNYDEIVKLVTHLALSQFDSNNLKKKVYFRLGTGAPTEEYFENPEGLKTFENMIKKTYSVVFKHKLFKGAEIEVTVLKVHFKPEGTASLISMSYEDNLTVKKEIEKVFAKGQCIIGMNIGSSTTDVAIMKSDMTFDSSGFFGIEVGTSNALNLIRDRLYKEYKYDASKIKVDYLVRNYQKVSYKGKVIDLDEIKKQPIENMFALLKTKFYDQIEMKGIDLGEAGGLFISGGAVLLTGDRFKNFIAGVPSVLSLDPLFEDARGYFMEAQINELLENKLESEIFESIEEEIEEVSE